MRAIPGIPTFSGHLRSRIRDQGLPAVARAILSRPPPLPAWPPERQGEPLFVLRGSSARDRSSVSRPAAKHHHLLAPALQPPPAKWNQPIAMARACADFTLLENTCVALASWLFFTDDMPAKRPHEKLRDARMITGGVLISSKECEYCLRIVPSRQSRYEASRPRSDEAEGAVGAIDGAAWDDARDDCRRRRKRIDDSPWRQRDCAAARFHRTGVSTSGFLFSALTARDAGSARAATMVSAVPSQAESARSSRCRVAVGLVGHRECWTPGMRAFSALSGCSSPESDQSGPGAIHHSSS